MQNVRKQEDISVNLASVKKGIARMTNWKAPGPDGVQGYWFKRFSNIHTQIAHHLQGCIDTEMVPAWMTTGRTLLIQKYHVETKIIPFVVGALGTAPRNLGKSFEALEIPGVTGSIQTAAVLARL